MKRYFIAGIEVEKEIEEKILASEVSWAAEAIERIFKLDDEPATIGHAQLDEAEPEGPNYFLIGGSYSQLQ